MAQFLDSSVFQYFVLPLVTILFSVFVKSTSKNDVYSVFRKEDLAVGLELALIALITFVVHYVSLVNEKFNTPGLSPQELSLLKDKIVAGPWLIVAFVIGLWGISTLVRKKGWKSRDELNVYCGIVFPFAYGIISLVSVFYFIAN